MSVIEVILSVYVLLLGLALGSFINVLADRLPIGKSIRGRSHCDHCKHLLSPMDLVPVISYFALGGRCRYCHKSLSWHYSLVEGATALILLLFFWRLGSVIGLNSVLTLLTVLTVLALSLSDFFYQIIPDEFLTLIFALGVLVNYDHLIYYLGGAVAMSAAFWFIHHLSNGRAMGFGDIKYVFVMGFWLPLPTLLLALYLAFVFGGLISLLLVLFRIKTLKSAIAFGPFLSIGFLISLWFAN